MRFHIATWGCQMNDHDSEKMSGLLAAMGYEPADGPDDADLVLLNTCSVREKAAHKAFSELGRLRAAKAGRAAGAMRIGVAGCLAQQEGEKIFARAPFVDFVMGTAALKQLPRLVQEARSGAGRAVDTNFYPDNHLFPTESIRRGPTAKALVAIIEGCDHACTYCVVPATRGAQRHRPFRDIVAEVECLVGRGFREVELLGQNVNGYYGGCTFAELLHRVAAVGGLEWIRFTTSHPMNFTRELADALAAIPKVAPFLHLPVQSGSDRVLRRMGRGYTAKEYMERVAYLGERRGSICLSTDFIVGFPGETDDDFGATMSILEEVRFDASFSFIYSPRPGTPALRLGDDVPDDVKHERLARLQARQLELTLRSHARLVGKVEPVRVESQGPAEGGAWLARTAQWRNVRLENPSGRPLPFGRLVDARITAAGPHWLKAEALEDLTVADKDATLGSPPV
jgi:tRNA-2-methylthio-N6-dimethylallyladenosine synthase